MAGYLLARHDEIVATGVELGSQYFCVKDAPAPKFSEQLTYKQMLKDNFPQNRMR